MKLLFISETATGRLHERARALDEATAGTRVVFVCARFFDGPRSTTPAGRLIRRLMQNMTARFVSAHDFEPMRETGDLDELAQAIWGEGARLNSLCFPADPQTVSLIVVADTPRLWELAKRLGATVNPAALVNSADVVVSLSEL
jgi:hypothetical protein